MTKKKDALTKTDIKAIDSLRTRGFAVVVFNEEELEGAPADDVESRLIELGWDVIEALRGEEDEDEEEEDEDDD